MSRERLVLGGILVALGAGWGVTQPLAKIAVSEGYRHFGLVFWQLAIGSVVLGAISAVQRRGLSRRPEALVMYLVVALFGTVLPNSASFEAARHLPSGILSIVLSLVPMLAFPIAIAMGNDRFSALRLAGLACGLGGVAMIALPGSSLPDAGMAAWLPLAMVAPAFYALEGNVVARWGTGGVAPIQLLFGASLTGAIVMLPVALLSGEWIDPSPPWHAPDAALVTSATIHAFVYSGYVWLVRRAGAVFAVQCSYLVTIFGVGWAMLILDETYSGWIWAALAAMLSGLFLVQPRRPAAELVNEAV